MYTWRRILHPTDLSGASRVAFRWAIEVARRHGAEVVIVHVVVPTGAFETELIGSPAVDETYEAERRRWAGGAVAELVAGARRRGVSARGVVVEGDPGHLIPRLAASMRADVVVMGSHGRSRLCRLLFGSTVDAVIQRAACPVLTVGRTPRLAPVPASRDPVSEPSGSAV